MAWINLSLILKLNFGKSLVDFKKATLINKV